MIILLRHCERDMNNSTFDSILLEEGTVNAETKVISLLEKYDFDFIYSSPYIRCLQTLKPYTNCYKKTINVDYNLCETFKNISKSEIYRDLSKVEQIEYNVSDIFLTSYFDVKSRVQCFLNYIGEHHLDSEHILVCTHECIIKEILKQKLGYYFGYHEMGKIYSVVPIKYAVGPIIFIIPYLYYLKQFKLLKEKLLQTYFNLK